MKVVFIDNYGKVCYETEDLGFFKFSDGAVHVKVPVDELELTNIKRINIIMDNYSPDDIVALLMVHDALKRNFKDIDLKLFIPFFPYARQDHISDVGESLSLKVFADLINSLNFSEVVTFDLHSSVSNALINNLTEIQQKVMVYSILAKMDIDWSKTVLVAPDAGAAKKIYKLSVLLPNVSVIMADKVRNNVGEIISTTVFHDDFNGNDVIIVDDIIDGGRTFIELAKVLKTKNCGKIILIVTHGIFSKGVDVLIDGGIDEIHTTNTFNHNQQHPKLTTYLIIADDYI